MDVIEKYGQDAADLVRKIESFMKRRLEHQSFGENVYAQYAEFCMTDVPDIGVFVVKFPKFPEVVLAGINMETGDYYFETTDFGQVKLEVHELDDFNISRLIDQAESEWSIEAQIPDLN